MANPSKRPNIASLISPLIKRGVPAKDGIRAIEAKLPGVDRRIIARTWGQVSASIAKRPDIATMAPSRRPGPAVRTEWSTNRQRGYLDQMEIQSRLTGTNEVLTRFHSVRSSRLLTIGDALQQGIDFLSQNEDKYGEEVLGGIVTGVYEMVPTEG